MPDNSFYYHAGYAVATTIYIVYSVTLLIRWNRVKARLPGKDE